MRRILPSACFCAALLFLAGAGTVRAQTASQRDAAEEQGEFKWHLINSALFAAVLGFAIWKSAPAFFNARSADIQKAIREATGLKMQADLRYSEIDRKMATLGDEVKRMREQARLEMEREHQRRSDETTAELEHIRSSIAAEVEALRSEAAYQVRQQTAQLAFRLAESKLRDSARSFANDETLRDFLHLVERGKQ